MCFSEQANEENNDACNKNPTLRSCRGITIITRVLINRWCDLLPFQIANNLPCPWEVWTGEVMKLPRLSPGWEVNSARGSLSRHYIWATVRAGKTEDPGGGWWGRSHRWLLITIEEWPLTEPCSTLQAQLQFGGFDLVETHAASPTLASAKWGRRACPSVHRGSIGAGQPEQPQLPGAGPEVLSAGKRSAYRKDNHLFSLFI